MQAIGLRLVPGHMDMPGRDDDALGESSSSPSGPTSLHPGQPARSPDMRTGALIPSFMASVIASSTWVALRTGPSDPDPLQLPLGPTTVTCSSAGKLARPTSASSFGWARRGRCRGGTCRSVWDECTRRRRQIPDRQQTAPPAGPKLSAGQLRIINFLVFPNHSTYFPWDFGAAWAYPAQAENTGAAALVFDSFLFIIYITLAHFFPFVNPFSRDFPRDSHFFFAAV